MLKTIQAVLAINALRDHAGLTQHAEVVRGRGLRDRQRETAAGVLLPVGKLRNDPQANWVTERVQHIRKTQINRTGWLLAPGRSQRPSGNRHLGRCRHRSGPHYLS